MPFPRQSEVELPLLKVLAELGGSAKPQDTYPRVARYFPNLSPAEQDQRLENYPGTRTWWNLVQWARQKLVEVGEIDRSTPGIWKLTQQGYNRLSATPHPPEALFQTFPAETEAPKTDSVGSPRPSGSREPEITLRDLANQSRNDAKARLLSQLRDLTPTAFERFCMELLQQLGYRNVAVTKRSGDGGIDGRGDFRQGAVSIKSAFQAKRWTDNPVGRPDIDRLRGAVQGEYDHGVFITTSRFTAEARDASFRKGAISILLLDGDAITELMLDRGIGTVRQPVYLYEIAADFFEFEET